MNAPINNRDARLCHAAKPADIRTGGTMMSCEAKRITPRWVADPLFHPPLHTVVRGGPGILNSFTSRRTSVRARKSPLGNN